METKTLLEQAKPELIGKLFQNRIKYEFVCNQLIDVLTAKTSYYDLTVDELNNLTTFTDFNPADINIIEYRHGGWLLTETK
jgi:hypothetical protein